MQRSKVYVARCNEFCPAKLQTFQVGELLQAIKPRGCLCQGVPGTDEMHSQDTQVDTANKEAPRGGWLQCHNIEHMQRLDVVCEKGVHNAGLGVEAGVGKCMDAVGTGGKPGNIGGVGGMVCRCEKHQAGRGGQLYSVPCSTGARKEVVPCAAHLHAGQLWGHLMLMIVMHHVLVVSVVCPPTTLSTRGSIENICCKHANGTLDISTSLSPFIMCGSSRGTNIEKTHGQHLDGHHGRDEVVRVVRVWFE